MANSRDSAVKADSTTGTARAAGFTLIELLVVMAIVAVLLAHIIPALQQAREAARRTQCRSNLRQIGLALQNYSDANKLFPPSACISRAGTWSIHARLLPYLDQASAYSEIRLDLDWSDPLNQATGISQLPIPVYYCPSDPNGQTLDDDDPDEGFVRPVNYGFNLGTWFVFDPATGVGGDGCFFPNSSLGPGSITAWAHAIRWPRRTSRRFHRTFAIRQILAPFHRPRRVHCRTMPARRCLNWGRM
jgi:prepilin-type N-terminal cleavage/methylation domain-containing protein